MADAMVCAYRDRNFACDASEASTRSDAEGRWTLTLPPGTEPATLLVLAQVLPEALGVAPDGEPGETSETGGPDGVAALLPLAAPNDTAEVVSALSTLVAAELASGAPDGGSDPGGGPASGPDRDSTAAERALRTGLGLPQDFALLGADASAATDERTPHGRLGTYSPPPS